MPAIDDEFGDSHQRLAGVAGGQVANCWQARR